MSGAFEALEILRKAGMKIRPVENESKASIDYACAEEVAVCSIKVEKTNYDGIRLELVSIDRSEEQVKATIDMLVEAICMLRDEIGDMRLQAELRDPCPF